MEKSEILKIVCQDIEEKFGIRHQSTEEMTGGWMNLKWRLNKENSKVIKVISKERYGFDPKRIEFIKQALLYQDTVQKKSGVTPKVYSHKGHVLQETNQIHYLLMDYYEGVEKNFDTITSSEMTRLGEVCAKLHTTIEGMDQSALATDHLNHLEQYIQSIDRKEWQDPQLFDRVVSIFQKTEWSLLASLPIGITHSDFSGDNMLFSKDGLAILDFDRCRISFQHQDIGRSIMSFAFDGKRLIKKRIDDFMKGYGLVRPIYYEDIQKALQLTWVIEVTWWLNPQMLNRQYTLKIERFKDELKWLTENWDALFL